MTDVAEQYPSLDEERRGGVIKKTWKTKPKHKTPVHQIDPQDPELDEEELYDDLQKRG